MALSALAQAVEATELSKSPWEAWSTGGGGAGAGAGKQQQQHHHVLSLPASFRPPSLLRGSLGRYYHAIGIPSHH